MRGQVERLTTLASELLDLSRLEAGVLELRAEPTDVHQLARDVAGEFAPHRRGRRSSTSSSSTPTRCEIECDPERVAQVVGILLDNALIHTPREPVSSFRRRAKRAGTPGGLDSGLGIRRQTMPHIFEPLHLLRPRAGRRPRPGIAASSPERMDGELSVHSVPGATAFSLTLPVS